MAMPSPSICAKTLSVIGSSVEGRGSAAAAFAAFASLHSSPVVPRYAVRTARPRLVRVRCTYRGAAAALRLRCVHYARCRYA